MKSLLVLNIIISTLPLLLAFVAIRDAIKEHEKKALTAFIGIAIVWTCIVLSLLISGLYYPWLHWLLPGIFLMAMFLFLYPGPDIRGYSTPTKRIDERDIAFSRSELKKGSKHYNDYYTANPHLLKKDDYFRSLPGLTSSKSMFFDRQIFELTDINFEQIKKLHASVFMPAALNKLPLPDDHLNRLKADALKMGAHSFGTTKIKPYHIYSYKGRGDRYGEKLVDELPYAIAFTIEMDYDAMQQAPKAPVVLESSLQYLNAANIAINLAQTICKWGFKARAHIDGNYNVVCPLVAKDAGLGEIGRMGILMTPKLGPRVRIAVVTTNLELPVRNIKDDLSVIDFCEQCNICSAKCPSHAIPHEERKMIDGVERWQIDQEKCFTMWCKAGTDCGICMKQCPYSHPNTTSHQWMRWGIKNSHLFRRAALWMEKKIYQ